MTMIYFAIFTLFLASRISPLPAPTIAYSVDLPAPAIVYSAVIYNARRSTIQCTVFRSQPSGPMLSFGPFTIKKNEYQLIKEVTYDMGTWTEAAIIEKIQCGNLVVNAPFANVTSPVQNWEFHVEKNKIVSVGPSSYNTDN